MARRKEKLPIEESEVVQVPGASRSHPPRESQTIRVTVVLKSSELPKDHPTAKKVDRILSAQPHKRPQLTRQELEDFQCADDAHVEAVRRFARAHGLEVVEWSHLRHDLVLEGPVRAFQEAFQVDLRHYAHAKGIYRAHSGPVHVPADIRDAVECVLGLDDIPLLDSPHASQALPHRADSVPFTPLEIAEYYRFPPGATGKGQCIALIEFAGGYHSSDVRAFFKKLGLEPPQISDRSVHGARNQPLNHTMLNKMVAALKTDAEQAISDYGNYLGKFVDTLEVTMDIELAGSLAPGAELFVLFAPPTAQAWRDSLYAALAEPQISVISISWGNAEYRFSEPHVRGIQDALNAARLRHVTVCCASGDYGSRATSAILEANGLANVAFPASSPYALACGGTTLHRSGKKIKGERAWNRLVLWKKLATGGGISGRFALPDYQTRVRVPAPKRSSHKSIWLSNENAANPGYRGRGVPDVAADADAATGYQLVVGGQDFPGGGTSATAPLWAALVARLNECLGFRLGWVNPVFYHPNVAHTFRPVTRGDNDVCDGKIAYYRAGPSWNGCTGLGTPDGVRLLQALRKLMV